MPLVAITYDIGNGHEEAVIKGLPFRCPHSTVAPGPSGGQASTILAAGMFVRDRYLVRFTVKKNMLRRVMQMSVPRGGGDVEPDSRAVRECRTNLFGRREDSATVAMLLCERHRTQPDRRND